MIPKVPELTHLPSTRQAVLAVAAGVAPAEPPTNSSTRSTSNAATAADAAEAVMPAGSWISRVICGPVTLGVHRSPFGPTSVVSKAFAGSPPGPSTHHLG